jgi:hypothetical protein
VDYREWGHSARDPLDRVAARWSDGDDPEGDGYVDDDNDDRPTSWGGWSNGRYPEEARGTSDESASGAWAAGEWTTAEWAYGEHTGSWRSDPDWPPPQRSAAHDQQRPEGPRLDEPRYTGDPWLDEPSRPEGPRLDEPRYTDNPPPPNGDYFTGSRYRVGSARHAEPARETPARDTPTRWSNGRPRDGGHRSELPPLGASPERPSRGPSTARGQPATRSLSEARGLPAPRKAAAAGDQPGSRVPTRRRGELIRRPRPAPEVDEDDDVPRGYLAAILFTVMWYAAPVALYLLWVLTLGTTPEPNCLDPAGNPCGSPRAQALTGLADTLPRIAMALGLSLAVALIVRWTITPWRAITVGFAGSVVGAGIATVVLSVLGQTSTG